MPVIKTHAPDKKELARLLAAARGKRTLKEFSGLCGVNPSTLTRIMQQTNQGASSVTLMEAISENAAPESGVTLDALLKANGYTRYPLIDPATVYASRTEALVRDAILKGLLARNAEVSLENTRYQISKSMMFQPDIQVRTNIFGDEWRVWLMEVLPPYIGTQSNIPSRAGSAWTARVTQKTFQTISRFSFLGTQASKEQTPAQYSIVTSEKAVFNVLVEEFHNTIVPVKLSLLLVDTDAGLVENEFFLPTADGSQTPHSFFKQMQDTKGPQVDEFADSDDKLTIQEDAE